MVKLVTPNTAEKALALTLARRWDLTPHTGLHLACLMSRKAGLTVSSGRRTVEGNKRAGGSWNSWHLVGRAVDLTGGLQTLTSARVLARDLRVSDTCTGPEEVLLEYAETIRQHLHVAW